MWRVSAGLSIGRLATGPACACSCLVTYPALRLISWACHLSQDSTSCARLCVQIQSSACTSTFRPAPLSTAVLLLPRHMAVLADTVICMHEYLPADVTAQAQAISRRHAGPGDSLPRPEQYGEVTPRTLASGECQTSYQSVQD